MQLTDRQRHGWRDQILLALALLVSASRSEAQSLLTLPVAFHIGSHASGNVYRGQFRRGLRHGRGVFIYSSGGRYEGGYHNGNRVGANLSERRRL